MKPGGPYILQVNDIELKDILVGDVWLCSGQSNMELPVSRVTDMFRDEISAYENTNIRQLKVPNLFNFHAPQTDLPDYVAWKPLTQENVMNFSALGYFFAKAMYEKNNIPVGLINSSWGGTPVEAWISEEGLKVFCDFSVVGAFIGGILSFIFGKPDVLIYALLGLTIIDFITGLIKAVYTKTLSSEICFKGVLKKITIYLVVATAVIVNNVIGGNIPLREVVITFFICNEQLSSVVEYCHQLHCLQ